MRKLLVILLCLYSVSLFGQDLLTGRKTSYYTYIYKITDKEAENIYKRNLWEADQSLLHTLVDSLPTDSIHKLHLDPGHYLKACSEDSRLNLEITAVHNFDIRILNNNSDLNIQVFDSIGNIVSNAEVQINRKKLQFDKQTLTYCHKKSNKKGIVKVSYNNQVSYYNLERDLNNSRFKRISRKAIYKTPVRYVWTPVSYIVRLPVDGTISLVRGYPNRSIWKLHDFFIKAFEKVACIFDSYYCEEDIDDSYYNGYMVFNKPKYHPKDTVKLKAFVFGKKEKVYNDEVNVVLYKSWNDQIQLAKISPYHKGGYNFEFYLHDSLDLKLDKSYRIVLKKIKTGQNLISKYFEYEDYELTKSELNLRLDNQNHYRGNDFKIFVKGKDENELNLLDASIDVFVECGEIKRYFSKKEFVPDTLFFLRKQLDPTNETQITIPDSIFPHVNCSYKVNVKLHTSDNETLSQTKIVNYFYKDEKIDFELEQDSIRFIYLVNGNSVVKDVELSGIDGFGNKFNTKRVSFPFKDILNPYFNSYEINTKSLTRTIDISTESSGIQCLSDRNLDSLHIVIENKRNIPFNYYIYKLNKEIKKGHSKNQFEFKENVQNDKNYYVSLQYLWGGKVKEEDYEISINKTKLNIQIDQPPIIYPGKKAKIEINVTDVNGNLIEGVDITAFGLTKKFNYSPPKFPNLDKRRKVREKINSFETKKFNSVTYNKSLNYEQWKLIAGLDSIEFYKFIYPEKDIYTYTYDVKDSITQFSPFVIHNGEIQPIGIIYVDNRPVYFNWTNNYKPYSFRIDSGYHRITLRLENRSILIDSLYFQEHKKTIFSLNNTLKTKHIIIREMPLYLSESEKDKINKYLFVYKNNYKENFAYLKQNDNLFILNYSDNVNDWHNFNSFSNKVIVGPLYMNYTEFKLMDKFNTPFVFEPFFEYDFSPKILKMRCVNRPGIYPHRISSNEIYELDQEVFTEKRIEEDWERYINKKKYATARYYNPIFTNSGNGVLQINSEFDSDDELIPLNSLLFKYSNTKFIRVYPGQTKDFQDLSEGYYRLVLFYPGAKYALVDSILVKPNGLNYIDISDIKPKEKDLFSKHISQLITKNIFKTYNRNSEIKEEELNTIKNIYNSRYNADRPSNSICGYVIGEEDGLSIPGVSVVVKGDATIGTVTDIDGFYCLTVPANAKKLVYSFIGMKSAEVPINGKNVIDVNMEAEVLEMDAVVVTAIGISRSAKKLGYSVETVGNEMLEPNILSNLQGKVAGVSIVSVGGVPGATEKITIRGNSSLNANNQPLFVVDGVIYSGGDFDLNADNIENMQVLKGNAATALYGSRASSGVVLITLKDKSLSAKLSTSKKAVDFNSGFMEAASQANSIRNNFSDYAYWQPKLITNKEGKASFEVTFPDDVTNWSTFVLAINEDMQTGQVQRSIKSFKPLMAQLAIPRFLVEDDSIYAIGKSLNYTMDSIPITTNFEINDSLIFSKKNICINSIIDSLEIVPSNTDTIKAKYFLEKTDGYFDGEEREIPVFQKGLEQTHGNFYVLDSDTTIDVQFNDTLGSINLYARLDEIEIIEEEIKRLFRYKYLCNEQLASKLKARLAYETILEFKENRKQDSKHINKLVKKLEKNQNMDGLWGWWNTSKSSYWISNHVLEALVEAKKHDYQVDIKESEMIDDLIWKLESLIKSDEKIQILYLMKQLDINLDYSRYIKKLEKDTILATYEKFKLVELKQICNLDYNINEILDKRQETLFGNIYFASDNEEFHICDNDIQLSLIAYRIIRRDSTTNDFYLTKIRNYFFEKRKSSSWTNTYESTQVIETILPDLLKAKSKTGEQKIEITGAINKSITEFPYSTNLSSNDKITIKKTGEYPIYLTTYQTFWDPEPKVKMNDFVINTKFEKNSLSLKAGESEKLIVDVEIKKDADYIMIEIPIPAGCSYNSKPKWFANEVHREYYKNQVSIFCRKLRKGDYQFEIDLMPRYSGKYTLNPAKIELMYFPTFNANNEIKKVNIK